MPFEEKHLLEVKEIFFESSTRKSFKDEAEKGAFFYKYVGFYLKHYPDYAFVAYADRVLGYVVGAPETLEEELLLIQPHLLSFKDYFTEYPAHLHINCHSEARGMGVGQQLVSELLKRLEASKIKGLHIMTGADARNKSFYHRLGFTFEVIENFQGSPILFMGKSLMENKL